MEKKKDQLKTERLLLKLLDESDRQPMADILCDKNIQKTYMLPDFENRKQAESLFERIMNFSRSENHFVYGIHLDDTLIGFVNDCEIKGDLIEIGYVIASEHQGKGYATEAIQSCIDELFRMGFGQVRAGFFEGNTASRRVMEKCGMHRIALEDDIEYRGKTHHCFYFEIVRPDA